MQQPRRDKRICTFLANEAGVAVGLRRRLDLIRALGADEIWVGEGYRDFPGWLGALMGISRWHARRLINAAHAIRTLPRVDRALTSGELSLEHVVELCRFVTPETEERYVKWAKTVTPTAVRKKADREIRKSKEEAAEADRSRFLNYWWMNDGRLGIEAVLPAEQGSVVLSALDRIADRIPDIVDNNDGLTRADVSIDVRRADALYALASARLANDQDADRATVVVRAPLEALAGHDERRCYIEPGPALAAETARRLSCDARVEFELHNDLGDVVGIGRTDRTPPAWMKRALKMRDGGCTFPGCDSRRFLHAHHVIHWSQGGPTNLDNLALVCTFHHRLVHEYGWLVRVGRDGPEWFRPGGIRLDPGPDPPEQSRIGGPATTQEDVRSDPLVGV